MDSISSAVVQAKLLLLSVKAPSSPSSLKAWLRLFTKLIMPAIGNCALNDSGKRQLEMVISLQRGSCYALLIRH